MCFDDVQTNMNQSTQLQDAIQQLKLKHAAEVERESAIQEVRIWIMI